MERKGYYRKMRRIIQVSFLCFAYQALCKDSGNVVGYTSESVVGQGMTVNRFQQPSGGPPKLAELMPDAPQGTEIAFFDGVEWVTAVADEGDDGTLHWFDKRNDDLADTYEVPIGAGIKYKLPEGERGSFMFNGEVRESYMNGAWKKVNRLANQGRLYLYSIDFADAKWAAELTFTTENTPPCVFCVSIPKIDAKASDEEIAVDMWFTINPTVPRAGRKFEGRSWKSYLDAYPDEIGRAVVRWPAPELPDIRAAGIACVERDAVLLTDKEHLQETIEALSYIVLPGVAPREAGGEYCGYQLRDRVFKGEDGRVAWREERKRQNGEAEDEGKKRKSDRSALKGKLLVEVVSANTARELERLFIERIENDPISDNRNGGRRGVGPRVQVLDEPLKVTDEFLGAVKREFGRIVYTGTMGGRQQIVRPAHEVAVGIWLAYLQRN